MTKPINLIYFGSPAFSAQILESLLTDPNLPINVVAVVTSPDASTGRHRTLTPSPLAQLADQYHLPVFKPNRLDDDNLKHLKLFEPDIFLVVSYGQIIPSSYLQTPKIATLNIHFSLLPKYRGALCISEAIKNQDKETGVTLMEMDQLLDHGPIITQQSVEISLDDDVSTLTQKLTLKAISLLKSSLPDYLSGQLKASPQDHSLATTTSTTKTRTRQSAFISWEQLNTSDPYQTHALIRSLNPDPGAWTTIPTTSGNIDVKLVKTHPDSDKLIIDLLQQAGKQPISFKQFLSGHSIKK